MSFNQTNTETNDIIDFLGYSSRNVTSKDKKKRVDQLKAIVRVLDDKQINPKDFTVSPELLKE